MRIGPDRYYNTTSFWMNIAKLQLLENHLNYIIIIIAKEPLSLRNGKLVNNISFFFGTFSYCTILLRTATTSDEYDGKNFNAVPLALTYVWSGRKKTKYLRLLQFIFHFVFQCYSCVFLGNLVKPGADSPSAVQEFSATSVKIDSAAAAPVLFFARQKFRDKRRQTAANRTGTQQATAEKRIRLST